MRKTPIIIDADPGTDDAFAIMMAATTDHFDIKAITAVAGNVGIEHTAKNALDMAEMLRLYDTRVAVGASLPMIVEQDVAPEVHGANGMGGFDLPAASKMKFEQKMAWDVIYEEAVKADGELELIAIGPLTNVAIAILKYPDLPALIPHLTIMGGGVTVGNRSAYAEFNIAVDPHAAEIVFESGMIITMADLDACKMVGMSEAEFDKFMSYDGIMSPLINHLMKDRKARMKEFAPPGTDPKDLKYGLGPDPVAMAYLIDPSMFETERHYVTVEVRSHSSMGRTIVDWRGKTGKAPNCDVIKSADNQKFVDICLAMVQKFAEMKE